MDFVKLIAGLLHRLGDDVTILKLGAAGTLVILAWLFLDAPPLAAVWPAMVVVYGTSILARRERAYRSRQASLAIDAQLKAEAAKYGGNGWML